MAGIIEQQAEWSALEAAESGLRRLSWLKNRALAVRARCALRLLHDVQVEHAFEALMVDVRVLRDEIHEEINADMAKEYAANEPEILAREMATAEFRALGKIPHPVPTWEIRRPLDSNPTVD